MNPRTTGILLLVAAALGAFVWLYEIRGGEERAEAEAREKRLFAGFEPEDVAWLALTTEDGVAVRAERREGAWQIVEPLAFPGDAFAFDGMAAAVAQIESQSVYETPQPLEVYGLGDAARDVRFGAGGAEHTLRTGNAAPMGGNSYAWIGGETAVYAVPTWRVTALRKNFDDLREKRILRFEAGAVERIAAHWDGERVELEKRDGTWRLTAPLEGPADEAVVNDFLSDLAFLRAQGFADAPEAAAAAGLDPPAFRVELWLAKPESGGEAPRLALAVGSAVENAERLVRAGEPTLYRIAAERLDDFPRRVVAWRFKQLAEFDPAAAKRIEMTFLEPGGSPVEITATRGAEGWSATPEAVAPGALARMVDALSHLTADDILAESLGEAERRGLGLEPANARLRVLGEAGEGGEATALADVRLGAVRDGIVAQAGDNPQVFRLAPERAEELPVSLEALRNRFLESAEGEADEPAPDPTELDLEQLLQPELQPESY
jgi:hypothetical protein